ncbi:uncharacterized protein LOC119370867 [Jatropha curcas]|uniref:uncharacterized protein LOC119370867 n=1 Tax=Jatropha curcas TaxID=180498 RepID=UPI0018942432|nr:uncharacterized protein LOC119370867 [Jatropha curcas]
MTCPFLGFLHIVSKDKIQSIYNQPYVLVLNRKLLTNGERYRLHLSIDPYCAICAGLVEDELHVLRDCFSGSFGAQSLLSVAGRFGQGEISGFLAMSAFPFMGHYKILCHWLLLFMSQIRAYGGGLLRTMKVNGSQVFVSNFGSCSVLNAELWGMLEGLYLAKGQGVSHLLIECDNTVAVQLKRLVFLS